VTYVLEISPWGVKLAGMSDRSEFRSRVRNAPRLGRYLIAGVILGLAATACAPAPTVEPAFDCQSHVPRGRYLWSWIRTPNARDVCPLEDVFVMEWDLNPTPAHGCAISWTATDSSCAYHVDLQCSIGYQFQIDLTEIGPDRLRGRAAVVYPFVGYCEYNIQMTNIDHLIVHDNVSIADDRAGPGPADASRP